MQKLLMVGLLLANIITKPSLASEHSERRPSPGPIYVPLDSWIYPALTRLASMGYVPDADSLARPWTRQQCSTLVEEAADIASRRSTRQSAGKLNSIALKLIKELKSEFGDETERRSTARIESIYSRYGQVSGSPLRDSYHFGQTFINDFGRPYGQGANAIDGISGFASTGRFSAYIRAEYQEAPATGSYSEKVRQFIGTTDGIPVPLTTAASSTSRLDAVEMYVGVALGRFDFTVGKQSMWWGPGEASALHFSDNAEPIYAIRLNQSTPIMLPGPFSILGRIRTQFLLGRLAGHQFPPRPLINAQKVTLQLTENLELGFTRSAIFGGVGHPLTTATFLRSFFSFSSSGNTLFGSANDPGDRRGGFDFRWYVPKLRRRVTIYSDSLADDDPNPLANPRRAAWAPGIYVTSLPHIQNLDFRFETYSTWLYRKDEGGRFIYWNNQYHDAYTNDGSLLGSWVGRDARVYTMSSSYWFSPQNKLTASFRQVKTGSNFLSGGGTQTDVSLSAQWCLRPGLLAGVSVQGERYFVPLLGSPRKEISTQMQLTFYPKNWVAQR